MCLCFVLKCLKFWSFINTWHSRFIIDGLIPKVIPFRLQEYYTTLICTKNASSRCSIGRPETVMDHKFFIIKGIRRNITSFLVAQKRRLQVSFIFIRLLLYEFWKHYLEKEINQSIQPKCVLIYNGFPQDSSNFWILDYRYLDLNLCIP